MFKLFERLYKEEEGQGLVEYALIIALIAVLCIVSIGGVRDAVIAVFEDIANKLKGETVGDGGET